MLAAGDEVCCGAGAAAGGAFDRRTDPPAGGSPRPAVARLTTARPRASWATAVPAVATTASEQAILKKALASASSSAPGERLELQATRRAKRDRIAQLSDGNSRT